MPEYPCFSSKLKIFQNLGVGQGDDEKLRTGFRLGSGFSKPVKCCLKTATYRKLQATLHKCHMLHWAQESVELEVPVVRAVHTCSAEPVVIY